MNLVKEILKGNHRAIGRAISLVENNLSGGQELMKEIFPRRKDSVILGITGAPGTGKSTLVDQMIGCLRLDDEKIGVVAVDPSSPFSGGAILGDRIRMMRHSVDAEVFIRSMATRGHLGGLAKATGEVIAILEAAGKSRILVETVGVGQDEVEVVKLADLVLVVLTPGSGDDIQAFKAGIMEIGDIFVLNKADSQEADKTLRQLRAMLEIGFQEREPPPIIKTVATQGEGVKELMEEIHKFIFQKDPVLQVSRKRRLISWMLRDVIKEKIFAVFTENIGDLEFEEYVERIFRRETDPYTIADELISRLKEKS